MDIIQDVLIYQTQMMRNSSLEPYVPADFSPPEYIVVVNALFYASLGVMLLAAFVAMLIKSWVREFDRGLEAISIPEQRAKTREFRYLGMERWKLQEMVALLPFLIQISLLLFAIGLVLFLFNISKPSFGVTTAIFGVGVLYYAITTTISVFVTASPFHSPLSRALGKVYQTVHASFCPGIDDFLSPKMDITPGTAFGHFRRHIQVFFQKSRPYLERDFVEPIVATTVDEVQLSTATSALQRIHDSVPNSPHSESIHQSVWQFAGSPSLRVQPLLKLPSWIIDRGNDNEYFSRLSPVNVVALTAVFVRTCDSRYRRRLIAVEDASRAVSDSQGSWTRVVLAIFDLLPDDFIHHARLHDVDLLQTLHVDALLRDTLPDAPSIDALRRRRIRERLGLDEFIPFSSISRNFRSISHYIRPEVLPLAVFRHPLFISAMTDTAVFDALRDVLRDAPLRLVYALLHDALLGDPRFDDVTFQEKTMRVSLEPKEPVDLINISRTNQMQDAESIWILNTLSGLHCDGLVLMKHHISKICLAILLHQAPKWNQMTPPNIMLIEAVITLAAISCSSNEIYQRKTLTNSHQHSWLLLNLRNPDLISRMTDEIDSNWREELISLLFLVIYALTLRGSKNLAELYLGIITARADFAFCASALSTIAPALGDDGFRVFRELLLAPRTQFLAPTAMSNDVSDFPHIGRSHQDLLNNYDLHLGASGSPDPKVAAILLLLFKGVQIWGFEPLSLTLRNPWLWFVANVATYNDIPHTRSMDIRSFHDHRVHNMFGALSLLLCSQGFTIYHLHGQFLFLTSFLEASHPAISCPILYHYMGLFGANTPPQPCYFSGALRIVFNPVLPGHHLPRGWVILERLLHKFDDYPAQWRRAFAEAFFSLSRRPLLKGSKQKGTPGSNQEISDILTWEYFCEEEPEHELSDAEFSGLDWMAMAWSLHLSQPSGTKVTVSAQEKNQPPSHEERWLNEQFILEVLCSLLDVAPDYSIIPNIPRLHEFVEWFDDSEHLSYKNAIYVRIEEAFHRDQECKMIYKFERFRCTWPM